MAVMQRNLGTEWASSDSAIAGLSIPVGPKMHLGCGEYYLKGYVNVDLPPSERGVMRNVRADIYADIGQLGFPPESVALFRCHHVLEHFDRGSALGLLCRWHYSLKPGGVVVIETPDFWASIRLLASRRYSYSQKQVVLRHVFGSHEAGWAVHQDGWYESKLRHVLSNLGFEELRFKFSKWKMTRNITVAGRKPRTLPQASLLQTAYELLRDSMVDDSASEVAQWRLWCGRVDHVFPVREPLNTING
jgi:predicted SAM-dependent methyltransferase